MPEYKKGDIIKCIVSGISKYGIFVHVDIYYDGLIHISEIANNYVSNINDFVSVGDTIYCLVLDVDEKRHQLKLSIKDINYKEDMIYKGIKETRKGFLPLKEMLPKWIEEAKERYKE